MSNVIVTGFAGAGKSTLAKQLAADLGATVVSADEFRYERGTWTKRPLAEFQAAVEAAIAHVRGPWVYESSYLDISDPENARGVVIDTLLSTYRDVTLYVLHGPCRTLQENVIARSLARAAGRLGTEAGATESPRSILALIRKIEDGYDRVNASLQQLRINVAHDPCVSVVWKNAYSGV
jgi:hypothetical protein